MQAKRVIGGIAGVGAVAVLASLIAGSDNAGFSPVAEIPLQEMSSSLEMIKKDPAPAPKIVFSEIFPNPEGSDDGKEFIKLFNAGAGDVDLKGWVIQILKKSDGARTTLVKIGGQSDDVSLIHANGFIAIGFSGNTSADIVRQTSLVNSTPTFFLLDTEGVIRDQVTVGTLEEGEIFKR